jgi:hypothetical protein
LATRLIEAADDGIPSIRVRGSRLTAPLVRLPAPHRVALDDTVLLELVWIQDRVDFLFAVSTQ